MSAKERITELEKQLAYERLEHEHFEREWASAVRQLHEMMAARDRMADTAERLEQELRAAREDVARLEWLDDWVADVRFKGDDLDRCCVHGWQSGGQIVVGEGRDIRAAIDAASKEDGNA